MEEEAQEGSLSFSFSPVKLLLLLKFDVVLFIVVFVVVSTADSEKRMRSR